MNSYLKTIIKAQNLVKQLLNDTTYGTITLEDITITKPEDLTRNLPLGSLITVGVSEWLLTSAETERLWQNYTQGIILNNEDMYLYMLKSIDKGATVRLLHKGS